MDWQDFLREQAKKHDLSPQETDILLKRFPEKEHYIKPEAQIQDILNEGIPNIKHQIGVETVTKRMQEIYKKFQADCPELQQLSRGKLEILREWLIEQFIIINDDKPLKRCILGLKGNYQEARGKLSEIAQALQDRFNDKTLSIAKVEEGSIILIVQSSQTGYEQLKTLIGQEIGDEEFQFQVEYVIDEWQDICRRMLLGQKPLTSNTVLAQVVGNSSENRDLIDEDLFVDLALVKPKRSENPKHPQEIDPAKGSDFFTRQEQAVEKRFAYREFLDEVIGQRTEKRLAIIGEPGAGKTTLLQKLAFWLLQETDDLVVWVSLAELGSKPLGEYLEQKWLTEALRLSREEIKGDWEQKFKGGTVWALLDGFDEMSQTGQQALKFRGWVMDARMIVTCRLNLWQANPSQLQNFQTYLTQPFDDEKMQTFIRRWFRGLVAEGEDVQLAESLWSELQESGKERIKDLCRNPLRLTLLCSTWKLKKALPDTIAELYGKFVEAVYKWKKKAFTVGKEEKKQLNAALGKLAKASLEAETSRFRLTHRLVCEYFEELDEDSLVVRLGWLNQVGVAEENTGEKVYTFYHATFQEYFAALAVEDWDYFLPKDHVDRPVEGKRYRIFEPQWKQVILLWLGRGDVKDVEKEAFIRALVDSKDGCEEWNFEKVDRGFYEYRAYFLTAAGINEFKACSLANDIVRQAVKWGFGEFDIQKQKWRTFLNPIEEAARKAIPETIRRPAISELIQIIKNCPDEFICMQAAESLGKINPGNPQAITALIRILETTVNEPNRWDAAENLGKIGQGNPQAIAALIRSLEITEEEFTRMLAAESLGEIGQGNPQVIADLIRILETTKDADTRRWAADSLEKIGQGNPQVIADLIGILETTKDEDTRRWAAYSLGKIAQGNPQAITALIRSLETTKDEDTRRQTVDSLGKIAQGNPQAITALIRSLETTKDEDTRKWAADSLGKIGQGNLQVITALIRILETTEDEFTRSWVAGSLGKINPGNPDAIAALIRSLETTKDEFIRWQAADSLEEINPGHLQAIATFIRVLETTKDEFIRWQAANSLGKIERGNPQVIAALIRVLETTEKEFTRWQAIGSLGKIGRGNPQVIAALIRVLETTENEVTRRQTVDSLGKIGQGNPQAIAALIRILETTEMKFTHSQTVESLGKIGQGNPQAIAALLQILRTTEDEDIRWWVAWSLEKILTTRQHYAGVVSALKDCLSDEVYQNNFKLFDASYKLIWNCAENLPYPNFYQAWHHPVEMPHPEVEDNTPVGNATVKSRDILLAYLRSQLQNRPIYCLDADILADETDKSEIALTLCQLIWNEAFPNETYPKGVSTPSLLREHLQDLKLRQNPPKLAILIDRLPCDQVIEFCRKLTTVVGVAFLTEEPLEAPLKGFPPNQPNLLSAIETWLEEI